ncbi:MAG: hypothetical protein BJ554DRAFT_6537 [Olpidium bornovanus]|uniref:Uncharacterized protein n=1 Tax=Olpidium bornovanus TaxID=278681 RepID=A0A8H8DK41_9FUNG|nr:MAG: hypothetical protein BJ554DRAFT_6537 [Olpidium bornovanus]
MLGRESDGRGYACRVQGNRPRRGVRGCMELFPESASPEHHQLSRLVRTGGWERSCFNLSPIAYAKPALVLPPLRSASHFPPLARRILSEKLVP